MESFKKAMRIATCKKGTFALFVIMRTICNLMMIGNALIFGELINMVSRGETLKRIIIAIILTALYSILWCVLRWVTYLKIQKYVVYVQQNYRCKYINALLGSQFGKVVVDDSSTYINSISNDIDNMVGISVHYCSDFFGCIISVIASFCSALYLRWEIALTMVGFTLIMAVLPFFFKKRLENSMVQNSKRKGEYLGIVKENLLGLSIIKSYGGEKQCYSRIKDVDDRYVSSSYKVININTVAGELSNTIRQFALVILIAATCYCVYIKIVEVGAVLSVFSIGQSFYGYIMYASSIVTAIFSINGITDKVNNIINMPVMEEGKAPQYNDNITFNKVSFAYPTDKDKRVLESINLKFERNKKYLVLGASGSGKSTVIKLIAKLYDNYEGNISIDGVSYSEYSEKDISKIISLSQQDGYLFNRTLRDNIDFLGTKDEERLNRVIDDCMLTDFVSKLPMGTDIVLNEEVNQVSGGEKLRINLARALYKDGKILLLDEVTSALDKNTSDKVERNILSICDKTIINVCHKFNDGNLSLYDEIIIIENGKVALSGDFNAIKDNPVLLKYRNIKG